METYTSGTGRETERIRVEPTPEEAKALADAADALERLLGPDCQGWPLLDGLRRIRKAYRIEVGP